MDKIRPFHVAFPVRDLQETRQFYETVLGCKIGRSAERWVDFDMFGHQMSAHHRPSELRAAETNPVDGKNVPVRHWGVILAWDDWHQLAERLKDHNVEFIVEPYIRFKGEPGEQATMFFLDPSGNALEFKSFRDDADIFRAS